MAKSVEEFKNEREKLNEIVLSGDNINIKRFFGIDTAVYRDGALVRRASRLWNELQEDKSA